MGHGKTDNHNNHDDDPSLTQTGGPCSRTSCLTTNEIAVLWPVRRIADVLVFWLRSIIIAPHTPMQSSTRVLARTAH
jgi:hypothetical protein